MKVRLLYMMLTMALIFTAGTTVFADTENPFSQYIKPITNPVFFDDVQNRTYIHVITILQQLPNHIKIDAEVPLLAPLVGRGGKLRLREELDGDLQLTAVRINYAINERFSLIAAQDGYVDFEPDHTLDSGNGWANLAVGFKGAIIYDPDDKFILSGKVLFGINNGDSEVFQGNGSGNVVPSLSFLKGWDKFQLQGTIGSKIPYNHNDESTMLYSSWHASYAVTREIFPLIELNYWRAIRNGNRNISKSRIDSSYRPLGLPVLPLVSAAHTRFEGGDVINLGSPSATSHRNFVTIALGCRFRYFDCLDVGVSWETPLTKQNQGLMKNRYSLDIVYYF